MQLSLRTTYRLELYLLNYRFLFNDTVSTAEMISGQDYRILFRTRSHTRWVPGVKRPGREAIHSPPSNAEINSWSCISTSSYVFVAWCLVKHSVSFTFTLPASIKFDHNSSAVLEDKNTTLQTDL